MENQKIQYGILLAMMLGITACDKNEQLLNTTSRDQPSGKIINFVPSTVRNTMGAYFEAIDTICDPYLKYTNKINISNLPDGYAFTITDGNLTLETLGDLGLFTKKSPAPNTWWANWNKAPYVEDENPAVLWMAGGYGTTITLSKKCYVFGFELSAEVGETSQAPFAYSVKYYDADNLPDDTPIGFLDNEVTSPSGARLYAIKSDIPFNRVQIYYNSSPVYEPWSWAITNIRYVTDKSVYDAHK
jgi:hypothetical protein